LPEPAESPNRHGKKNRDLWDLRRGGAVDWRSVTGAGGYRLWISEIEEAMNSPFPFQAHVSWWNLSPNGCHWFSAKPVVFRRPGQGQ
jgi:hypothetical protein